MVHAYTIRGELRRELPEKELDDLVQDLFPFAQRAHVRGKIFGKPNYVFNIINETVFNKVSEKFAGGIKVYIELDKHDPDIIDDICALMDYHEVEVMEVSRKWARP